MILLSVLPAGEIITALLLGGLLGTVGQGIRAVMGIKKMREENADPLKPSEEFNTSRLIGTLVIGFVAGILATFPFFKNEFSETPSWSQQIMLTLIAAGYSGVDFIEGFLKDYLVKKPLPNDTENTIPKTEENSMKIEPNQTVMG